MTDCLCMVPCLNGRQKHLVSLLHPQLSMLMKLQFFDIYQCIQVISMKKDISSGITPVIA